MGLCDLSGVCGFGDPAVRGVSGEGVREGGREGVGEV